MYDFNFGSNVENVRFEIKCATVKGNAKKNAVKMLLGRKVIELIFIIISNKRVAIAVIIRHSRILAFFLRKPAKNPAAPNPSI